MCGIVGVLNKDLQKPVSDQLLTAMCEVIHHRGPDEWGMWSEPGIGLGMKRLQIIDLAGGHQPMSAQDGRYQIVFNGEIYNFQDLKARLEARGHKFNSRCDTEVLLRSYIEFGTACVKELRGMFAFAIWDRRDKVLFMGRDRFGKKPLHYLDDGNHIVFGSEIKSILQHPDVRAEVHRPGIVDYMAYGNTMDPDSMFRGIKKVPAGHIFVWRDGKTTVEPYWDFEFAVDEQLTEADALEQLDEVLKEATRARLVSDVPLGAFLSGGIDSSLVVAMMATQMTDPVKTFSIGFEHPDFNELPYARMVAERYGTDHHEEIVHPDAEEVLPYLIDVFDEPFADSSAIPTYYVSRLAKKHVTVALSGDGGDELFGGYTRYQDATFAQRIDSVVPTPLRQAAAFLPTRLLPDSFTGMNTLRYLASDADSRYIAKMCKGLTGNHELVFSPGFVEDTGNSDPSGALKRHLATVKGLDSLSRRQYTDMKTYLPCDILAKVDRASMLASLECRAPLLDQYVAQFAATLPPRLRVQNRTLKYMLKKLAEKYLPHELIHRPKMGFSIPIGHWINADWKDLSEDLVLSPRALQRDNFQPEYLERIFAEHRRGRRNHGYQIWTLMVLEMWYRKFIDGKGS